ncbi:MAG: type I glutamate--ammonia ligase [Lachnospiraceae bacterium]|jgi:glutamine synthetase, type I|nr:type I glutamate--ammonia ligase [Lachnospiraceae bacterium]MCX4375688.1 type I glutamate--ammonia ligase [Lachnospiraceae bacterium]
MAKYTKQDIINMVAEEDVEFIRMQFTDIEGNFKNVAITASQLEKVLSNNCMFDCSLVEGMLPTDNADMFLYPDLDTFTIFPWRPQQGKVARFICDVYRADRTPFEGDCRYILKKALQEAQALGYTFEIGPECEFFLFNADENGRPTTNTNEQAGFLDMGPLDNGENARRDIVLTLEDMGFQVESSHHEKAPSQHEIDFRYDEALATADNIMTFKLAVKTIAKHHGLHATFMPKPRKEFCGSGMHINMSLRKDGKNVFDDPSDKNGLSKEAYYFMGGLMKHVKGICAVTNPLVNSYKRLKPGFEAPVFIAWSTLGANTLIRIPNIRGEHTRIELRSPDPAANPYLAIAACLMAGLDGIKNKIEPKPESRESMNALAEEDAAIRRLEKLPTDLLEACKEMRKDTLLRDLLGDRVFEQFYHSKVSAWKEYDSQVTSWEIDSYLYKF